MIPCMAGCAGPILRSISRVSRSAGSLGVGSVSMICDRSPTTRQKLPLSHLWGEGGRRPGEGQSVTERHSLGGQKLLVVDRVNQGLTLFDGVVLAQRVALKLFVHENAFQVRMAPKS